MRDEIRKTDIRPDNGIINIHITSYMYDEMFAIPESHLIFILFNNILF